MISAREALERLREGNRRFVSGVRNGGVAASQTRRYELAAGQAPVRHHSRVFRLARAGRDRLRPGPGRPVRHPRRRQHRRLLASRQRRVRRRAVRHAARGRAGSLPVRGGSGHTRGAQRPRENQSRNLRSIVDRIRPSVEALLATELRHDPEALIRHAIRTNVRVSAHQLRHGSEVLEHAIQRDGLVVVGAEYSLETGIVEFFDGVPGAD